MESTRRFDPEEIDLAAAARELRTTLGAPMEGLIVGRTRVRDARAQQLQCSLLEPDSSPTITSAALVTVLCRYCVLETVAPCLGVEPVQVRYTTSEA